MQSVACHDKHSFARDASCFLSKSPLLLPFSFLFFFWLNTKLLQSNYVTYVTDKEEEGEHGPTFSNILAILEERLEREVDFKIDCGIWRSVASSMLMDYWRGSEADMKRVCNFSFCSPLWTYIISGREYVLSLLAALGSYVNKKNMC